jgi:cell division protein FtsQ
VCAHPAIGITENLNNMARKLQSAAENNAHFTRNRVVVIAASFLAMMVAASGVWLMMGRTAASADATPMLPIRAVTFVGTMQRVDADELQRVAGGIKGSMLRTDLNDVKAAIKQVHWVRNADVRRRFPATLEVSIEEHRPYARWKDADAEDGFLVNTFGEVFEAEIDAALPIFGGPQGTSAEVLAAYNAFKAQLAAIGQTPLAVGLSARRAWQLRLDTGASLQLGRSEAAERLDRYVKAYAFVPALRVANAKVDLRYQSGMALMLADARPPSTAPVKTAVRKPTKKITTKS